MNIFDGHNDTVHRLREYREGGIDFIAGGEGGHLDLPRARAGGMVGGLFAIFVRPEHPPQPNTSKEARVVPAGEEPRLPDPVPHDYAARKGAEQLAALKALAARSDGQVRIETSVNGIRAATAAGAFTIVLHMEGAEPIAEDLTGLEDFYDAGLRSLGLVWSRPNAFATGVPFAYNRSPDTGPGLTQAGRDLVRACNRMGILIDLAHLNERGFWDVAGLSTAPLVATHACAHAITPTTRNLTDRQLDAIRDSDGLVGCNFAVGDVRPDGRRDAETPIEMLTAHIAYLADRLGIERVAIGSDFDGTIVPAPIKDAAGLPVLIGALRARGFDDDALRRIAFENWMRVFGLTWRR